MDYLNKKSIITIILSGISAGAAYSLGYIFGKKRIKRDLYCDGEINIIENNNDQTDLFLKISDKSIFNMKNKEYAIFKVKIIVDEDNAKAIHQQFDA